MQEKVKKVEEGSGKAAERELRIQEAFLMGKGLGDRGGPAAWGPYGTGETGGSLSCSV